MRTAALIREAQASGIELRLVGGKVKAIGPREAVARLIAPLREHKLALVCALQVVQPNALPTPEAANPVSPPDWHALDAAYNVHHFNCPTCIAAGRGSHYGQRCGVGMALWRSYQDA